MVVHLTEKSELIKTLKDRGIPVPAKATTAQLRHRAEHWRSGEGFLLRLALPPSRRPGSAASLLESFDTVYWVPDSRMASLIIETKLVFIMGRCETPPEHAVVLDVPEDFSDRWPVGGTDGGIN
jgi:hypothetical protein